MIGAIRDALRMETVRMFTVRSTYVLLAAAVLVGTLVSLLLALLLPAGTMGAEDTTTVLTGGADAAPLSVVGAFVGVLGAVTVSHDYRWGLVRAVLTAVPRRGALVLARLVLLGMVGAALATLVTVLAAGSCVAFGRRPDLDGTTLRVIAFQAGVAVGWAWLGAGLGWLLRHAAGAVGVLLGLPLAVEPVLTLASTLGGVASLGPVVPWLPFAAAREALGRGLMPDGDAVGALPAAGAFAGTVVIVIALAWVRVTRTDA